MKLVEYRIPMPLTADEYKIGQLYSVADASSNETGGGEGVEVLVNEPFSQTEGVQPHEPLLAGHENGQYTKKIYHVASKLPLLVRKLAPAGSTEILEEAWNAYPYCRTIVTNPDYMKNSFEIKIETLHVDDDSGKLENVHKLNQEKLISRSVVNIDIASPPENKDYKSQTDPTKFKSEKTGRGHLTVGWMNDATVKMCCYKLVSVKFKWKVIGGKVESLIQRTEQRIFHNFHRELFCWVDKWHGMTIEDIRNYEQTTKELLDNKRKKGDVVGTTA
ncbi:Cytoplasmic phosphatidylinositol transfer protein 1 [Intoshia linei]|uniref:Cytoplasmic phosphatidylinositol transfer protein 1 n=1 Tax=Intoshia linei TaxID=1819745 RepID=A0A177AXE1_9BILA|nr:Cytoplasmic phosphatidylinositol transfer protein 1 [Intoshia linei]